MVDCQLVHFHDLDDYLESGRRFALQNGLLRAALLGLLIGKRDGLDAADEVRQGRVHQQIFQRIAVGRADKLHAALGDGAGGKRLLLDADLVNDDHFGHVVLDRLDHDGVLVIGFDDLHPAGAADGRVRDVAVAGDLVGGVHNDDALFELVGQHPRHFAQLGGLAASGLAQHQDGLAGLDHVPDNINGPVNGPPDAASQADDAALTIADGRDAVQSTLDAGPIVLAERADARGHEVNVLGGDRRVFAQPHGTAVGEARLSRAPEVHDDLDEAG